MSDIYIYTYIRVLVAVESHPEAERFIDGNL